MAKTHVTMKVNGAEVEGLVARARVGALAVAAAGGGEQQDRGGEGGLRPPEMMPTRSQIASTSGRMWVEKKTVFPCDLREKMMSRTSLRPTGSRPLIGSSSTSSRRSVIKVARRPSFCPMPLE